MSDFEQEYKKLNPAQQAAVEQIDGPVMVVAGPGTGKTQLLSMRVANILRSTDVLARNILCLTFTESAASAMRERLLGLIGPEAHKVAIHTFHSFGVEVINHYPEYFYNGARFSPSDEILQLEIIDSILRDLPHDNVLASTMNDRFVYARSIDQAIGHLKKAGLNSADLMAILDANQAVVAAVEPQFAQGFNVPRLSKSHLPRLRTCLVEYPELRESNLPEPFRPLGEVLRDSFESALTEAEELGKTTPITAWRNEWMEKNSGNEYVFKERKRNVRLLALAEIYERYNQELLRRERYDFSDMVLEVLSAIEREEELRLNLQEQYQYLLVDEFQDTNDGQLRLLYLLADNPVNEGRPDIMVVGDDDQAVYKFQGAEVSNIIHFQRKYPELTIITLRENYRSHQSVLDVAREVIVQGEVRLESELDELDKRLQAANSEVHEGQIHLHEYETAEHEYAGIAEAVAELIKDGTPAGEIAILGRQHRYLEELMPHLRAHNIPVAYDRRSDVLREFHIEQLLDLATLVDLLSRDEQDQANEYVSRVLSYPFWGLDPLDVWRLSLHAHEERRYWIEIMLETEGALAELAQWFLRQAQIARAEPLEYVLDRLIGVDETPEAYISPYRNYYFSPERFDEKRGEYLVFLSSLRVLRTRLREYKTQETLYLRDLIEFIDLHRINNLSIVDETPFVSTEEAVHVMTAHKSKGLEFEAVFIINAQSSVWTSRSGRQEISFPPNLPITPPGDELDDQLRLFFVAMTRAKSKLYISGHRYGSSGRPSLLVPFIDHALFSHIDPGETAQAVEILETSWQSYHPLPTAADAQAVLNPVLESYQLNVTHFTKFLDLISGGPHRFLLESLLQFPQAKSAAAAYGTATHAAIQEAYTELKQGNRLTTPEIIERFVHQLKRQRLREREFEKYLDLGQRELAAYLEARQASFAPEHVIEASFAKQGAVVEGARLSGRIDKIVLDKSDKQAIVYDYKTGKPLDSWSRRSGTDGMKAWRYQKQLIFYKLLVENSRSFGEYTVQRGSLEFIKPKDEQIIILEYDMQSEEVERTKRLIGAVWKCVMQLDFPDVNQYEPTLYGIRQFEDDLLARA